MWQVRENRRSSMPSPRSACPMLLRGPAAVVASTSAGVTAPFGARVGKVTSNGRDVRTISPTGTLSVRHSWMRANGRAVRTPTGLS